MQMSKLVLPARSVADKFLKREDVLFFLKCFASNLARFLDFQMIHNG